MNPFKVLIEEKKQKSSIERRKKYQISTDCDEDCLEEDEGFKRLPAAVKDPSTSRKGHERHSVRPIARNKITPDCHCDRQQGLHCACETRKHSHPSICHFTRKKNDLEQALKQDEKLKQLNTKYIRVVLPNVTNLGDKTETVREQVGMGREATFKNRKLQLKNLKITKKTRNQQKLALPLITFTPAFNSDLNCSISNRFHNNKNFAFRPLGSTSLTDKIYSNDMPNVLETDDSNQTCFNNQPPQTSFV